MTREIIYPYLREVLAMLLSDSKHICCKILCHVVRNTHFFVLAKQKGLQNDELALEFRLPSRKTKRWVLFRDLVLWFA